jgi:integrase/recombinase XerD
MPYIRNKEAYVMHCKGEAIIKIIGKLSMECPELNQLKVREVLEEVLYKYDVVQPETALTVSDIDEKIMIYIQTKRLEGLSEKTLHNYELNLNIFSNCLRKSVNLVTKEDMRMYLAARCKDMKATTKNTQISIMKSFFGWLYEEDYIEKNPMKQIKSTKVPGRLRNTLSNEELENLRQACITDREKALIEFMLSTGCRLSEIIGVNVNDIDWNAMSLRVIGKGNKEREVLFNVKAKILMKKYLKTRKGDSEALFISEHKPYRRMAGRGIETIVNKIAARAKMDKSVYPHLMRHSYGTHSINAGMPITVLQELMGHTNSATTLIYAKLSRATVEHEYKRINC